VSFNAFGVPIPAPVDLSAPELRQKAVLRLKHARAAAYRLFNDAQSWWAANKPAVHVRINKDDPTVIETVLAGWATLPPTEEWELQANDVFQNLRTALDSFAHSIAQAHQGPGARVDVMFPTAKNQQQWERWSGPKSLPELAVKRIFAMQPLNTGRAHLDDIRRLSNEGKHGFSIRAELHLTSMNTVGTYTIEGLPSDAEVKKASQAYVPQGPKGEDGPISPQSEEQVIIRHSTGFPVVETPQLEGASFTFDTQLIFGDDQYPLWPAIETFVKETEWAIAHVAGLHSSTTNPAYDFGLF
jgi:hypothetical protein